jgi:UDP-glucose:(heptosyl)LPS alpha-1,3-glucosyltransferase
LTFAILIFKYFPFGGVQRDMLRIAKDLIALGHKVTIYTGEWCGDLPDNIPVKVLPVRGILNHQRYQYLINQMQSAIKNQAFDRNNLTFFHVMIKAIRRGSYVN